jgi:hypothetical protein
VWRLLLGVWKILTESTLYIENGDQVSILTVSAERGRSLGQADRGLWCAGIRTPGGHVAPVASPALQTGPWTEADHGAGAR